MSKRVSFAGLTLALPETWRDVTDDLEQGAPFTLGREKNAAGALQFSTGMQIGGENANLSVSTLVALLKDFFAKKNLGTVQQTRVHAGEISYASAEQIDEESLVRVWYVTDSKHIALVTYVADINHAYIVQEMEEAEEIVKSVRFNDCTAHTNHSTAHAKDFDS